MEFTFGEGLMPCDYKIYANDDYIGLWCTETKIVVIDGDIIGRVQTLEDLKDRLSFGEHVAEGYYLEGKQ